MRAVHSTGAWLVVVCNGIAGIWALGAVKVPALRRTRALWRFTVAAEVAIFIQVALGVGLMAAEDIEAPRFHTFYGFVAIVTIAIVYSYRVQMADKRYWLYGGAGLFLMGLGIRAMVLAPSP